MRNALAGLLLLLAACSPSARIAEDANNIGDRAATIASLADQIGNSSKEPETIRAAATIHIEAKKIGQAVADIHATLPGVQDVTPWWATILKWLAGAVLMVAVAVILWQTGIGQAIRAAIGLIPRRKVQEASLAAAALDPSRAEGLRELIAAKRLADPLFDAAWRKEKNDGNPA